MSKDKKARTPITLYANIAKLARASSDPFVKEVERFLDLFACKFPIGTQFDWKYLPDDSFRSLVQSRPGDVWHVNHLLLSHLVRIIEAFEMASLWRAADLASGCVRSLNAQELTSASSTARALIELAAQYADAADRLPRTFEKFPWEHMRTHILDLEEESSMDDKKVSLESYIERRGAGSGEEWKRNPEES